MTNPYPENIAKIAKVLLEEIEKYYPGLTTKTYDSCGFVDKNGIPALDRASMCIYFELMKAGAFNEARK